MAKFPEPPPIDVLRRIGPTIVVLEPQTPLGRVFFRGGPHPTLWNDFRFWGPAQARFDHHLADALGRPRVGDRGILYAAGSSGNGALAICLAEVFQETRLIDPIDRTPWFVVFRTTRALPLLDLRGLWPTRAGASSAIASGSKARARRWSKAIYDAYGNVDGLVYRSSMGAGDAVALYERGRDALPFMPLFHRSLADPVLTPGLLKAARDLGYALL